MEQTMPLVIVITHFINLFDIVLLIRSGLHILADHPKLYWTDHTTDENYWLKFGHKKMPKDKVWTAHDEVEPIGRLALPGGGHKDFGSARNWHFAAAVVWIVTGLVYWGFLFFSGEWTRLIPTSWDVFPRAWESLVNYAQFSIPPESAFQPYDALQQLAYAFIVFGLAPLMVITAAAMSPALTGWFPGYTKLFGGRRQVARSLHFLGMMGFSLFILGHVTLVALVYFYRNVKLITFGTTSVDLAAALTVFAAGLLFILVFNVWASYMTVNHRVFTRAMLVKFYTPVVRGLLGRLISRQKYKESDISEFFRVNGYPPETEEYKKLQAADFKNWQLKVGGMVEQELALSLDELKGLPSHTQITKHVCIQGWTAIAKWQGVPMAEIVRRCQPQAGARFVVFYAYDEEDKGAPFYEALLL
jgi:DMSO/TMAO reductase YedYZ molybdopterin-dependent catalytic subunit